MARRILISKKYIYLLVTILFVILIGCSNDNKDLTGTTSRADNEVDLIIFMGQSNMSGYGGNASSAPNVPSENGMEYRVISNPNELVPVSEPFGLNENKEGGLNDRDKKKGSLVSSFVNEYHENTGRKIVAVSASVGGMAMDLWLNKGVYDDAIARISDSKDFLARNGYEIGNTFVVWLQGESDGTRDVPKDVYKKYFYEYMDGVLAAGADKVFIITPGRVFYDVNAYKEIIEVQQEICAEDDNFILATSALSDIPISQMSDAYHYNQTALNTIGEKAAYTVASYVLGRDGVED